jgi:NAD(P)-dependent dehydrogenase (short-subunit alcohol dehydrogenase family)
MRKSCTTIIQPIELTDLGGREVKRQASAQIGFIVFLVVLLSPMSAPFAQVEYRPTVLITGSNRGLGFEFAQQYAALDWRVIATARRPDTAEDLRALGDRHKNVIIEQLDVTNESQILSLATKYMAEPIDVLINNAGVGGSPGDPDTPISMDEFQRVLNVNAFGPLRVTQAFLPSVLLSSQKKVAVITSRLGSLTLVPNYTVGSPFDQSLYYSMSKAAVNMGMRRFAMQLKSRDVSIAILHPGPVVTDMLASSGFDLSKAFTPEQSIAGMIKYLDALSPEKSGLFYGHDGVEVPW